MRHMAWLYGGGSAALEPDTRQRVGIWCAGLNIGLATISIIAEVAHIPWVSFGPWGSLLIYGLYAVLTLNYRVWGAAHHFVRFIAAFDIIGITFILVHFRFRLHPGGWIIDGELAPCAALTFALATLSLRKDKKPVTFKIQSH